MNDQTILQPHERRKLSAALLRSVLRSGDVYPPFVFGY
jgi:hypothetical protein